MSAYPWLSKFKRKLNQQDLSKTTISGYLSDLHFFLKWFEEITLQKSKRPKPINIQKISSVDLRAFRQELINFKRQKTASVNRRIQSLKRFFAWATQTSFIKNNPALELKFLRRKSPTKPSALNKNEVHALLRVAGQSSHGLGKRNYAIVQIMLQAGLRIGEVAKLQYRDVTVKERSGVVRIVDGKGLKEREVPLNATARRALLYYFKTRNNLSPDDPVFASKQDGFPTVRALQLMMENLARKAKIQRLKVTAHTLRHTFASNYLKANPGELIELATLMGHESINTTAIYAKASRERLAEGVEKSEVNIYDD